MAVLVERQVADREQRAGPDRSRARPAHQPAEPGDDLLEAERLGHVVVPAGGEPGDAVLDGVPGGQEQHRHVGGVGAQAAQHLEAVDVGEHHVEHDDVGPELADGADGGQPVVRAPDVPALVAQGHREQLGERLLVVDDEDAQRAAVGPAHLLVSRRTTSS